MYEAVALGLHAIRISEWAGEIARGLNNVRVLVRDVPGEHNIKISAFEKWLARDGGSPQDMTARNRIRDILRS